MTHHLRTFEWAENTGPDAAARLFINSSELSLYLPGERPDGAQNQTLKSKR
jgi:hypothetical protein